MSTMYDVQLVEDELERIILDLIRLTNAMTRNTTKTKEADERVKEECRRLRREIIREQIGVV